MKLIAQIFIFTMFALILPFIAALFVEDLNSKNAQQAFYQKTYVISTELQDQFNNYIETLYALEILINAKENVNSETLRPHVSGFLARSLLDKSVSYQALIWVTKNDDGTFDVALQLPDGNESEAIGLNIADYPEYMSALEVANNNQSIAFLFDKPLPGFSVETTKNGLYVIRPVYSAQDHGKIDSYLMAAFDFGDIVEEVVFNIDTSNTMFNILTKIDTQATRPISRYDTAEEQTEKLLPKFLYKPEPLKRQYDIEAGNATFRIKFEEAEVLRPLLSVRAIITLLGGWALMTLIAIYLQNLKHRNRILNKAKIEAEHANQLKSDFLANMSHELRTPLNSVVGLSDILMQDKNVQVEHRGTLSSIKFSANKLVDIMNDILDFSKIESGGLELERKPFDIEEIVNRIHEKYLSLAVYKGLHFDITNNIDVIPLVEGDAPRFHRALSSLVDNAIKYTEEGSVQIITDLESRTNDELVFKFEVVDTGIGISEEQYEVIFEKFSQVDVSTTRKYGGTGLGLAIAKELTEMMGGEIVVDSTRGAGSKFTLYLPFTNVKHTISNNNLDTSKVSRTRKPNEMVPLKEAKILIAEDNELNIVLMQKLISKMGFENYHIAENGLLVLEQFKNGNYDVILMDCNMPEMDGWEVTEKIREHEKEHGGDVSIIAVTANAMVGDREKCLDVGMDDYLSKPLTEKKLLESLGKWVDFSDDQPVENTQPDQMLDKSLIDLSILDEYTDGDKEVEKELLTMFIEQADDLLKQLTENAVGGVHKPWNDAAHALKGIAANVGAKEMKKLSETAQQMEDVSVEDRKKQLDLLESSFKSAKDYINQHLK